jgi:hypothetical protein
MKVDGTLKQGFINRRGEIVIQPQFDWAEDFGPHGVTRITAGGSYDPFTFDNSKLRWGLIDTTGRVLIQPVFNRLWYENGSNNEILVGAQRGEERYVFDLSGRRLVPQR